ncbi:MAG TPA: hypothetical protein P5235_09610 [Saprospiraceae bacterium]|nr:hypothetical protein [Saprospiraceae bacterium]
MKNAIIEIEAISSAEEKNDTKVTPIHQQNVDINHRKKWYFIIFLFVIALSIVVYKNSGIVLSVGGGIVLLGFICYAVCCFSAAYKCNYQLRDQEDLDEELWK